MRREGGVKKWGNKGAREGKMDRRKGREKGGEVEGGIHRGKISDGSSQDRYRKQREKKEENGDRDLHSASVVDTDITQRAESLTCTSCADHNHSLLPVMYFLNRQKHLFDVHTSQTPA